MKTIHSEINPYSKRVSLEPQNQNKSKNDFGSQKKKKKEDDKLNNLNQNNYIYMNSLSIINDNSIFNKKNENSIENNNNVENIMKNNNKNNEINNINLNCNKGNNHKIEENKYYQY